MAFLHFLRDLPVKASAALMPPNESVLLLLMGDFHPGLVFYEILANGVNLFPPQQLSTIFGAPAAVGACAQTFRDAH